MLESPLPVKPSPSQHLAPFEGSFKLIFFYLQISQDIKLKGWEGGGVSAEEPDCIHLSIEVNFITAMFSPSLP